MGAEHSQLEGPQGPFLIPQTPVHMYRYTATKIRDIFSFMESSLMLSVLVTGPLKTVTTNRLPGERYET